MTGYGRFKENPGVLFSRQEEDDGEVFQPGDARVTGLWTRRYGLSVF